MIAGAYRRLRIYGNVPQLPSPYFCIPVVRRRARRENVTMSTVAAVACGWTCIAGDLLWRTTHRARSHIRPTCTCPPPFSPSFFLSVSLPTARRSHTGMITGITPIPRTTCVRPLPSMWTCVGHATQNSEAEIQICDNVKRGIKSSRLRSALQTRDSQVFLFFFARSRTEKNRLTVLTRRIR